MSSGAPQAVTLDLLVYQNKQLSRIVRSLKAAPKPLSNVQEGDIPADVLDQINTLLIRNRHLERKMIKFSALSTEVQSSTNNTRDLHALSVAHDSVADDNTNAQCAKCIFLTESYAKVSTAFAVLQSRIKEMESANFDSPVDQSLQSIVIERDTALSNLCTVDKSLSETRKQTEVRISDLIRSFGLGLEQFEMQITVLESESKKHQDLQHSLGNSGGNSHIPPCLEHGSGHVEIVTSTVDNQHTENEEPLNKLRDRLRMKEEQLSRTLMQHINQQVLMSETEKENEVLRRATKAEGVLIAQLNTAQEDFLRLSCAKFDRADCLMGEITERHELLDVCVKHLNKLSRMVSDAEESRTNFERVTRCLQTELSESVESLAEAKRVRFSSGSMQSSSTLVNIELDELKQKVRCTLCNTREKSVTLTTCMHCFCRECVNQQMLAARNRKCPLCNQRFADADVRDVHFLQS